MQYEDGKSHFGVKIASTLRTIFHNTPKSRAILPNLFDRHGIELNFVDQPNPAMSDDILKIIHNTYESKGIHFRKPSSHILPDIYIGFVIGNRVLTKDYFSAPFLTKCDFETYWNAIVYIEKSIVYTRKQMILFAANKYGGSHVDPKIPAKFLRLVDGSGPMLKSEQYGEQIIINRVVYRGRTASYPTAPSQIPACGTTALGFSKLLTSHTVLFT